MSGRSLAPFWSGHRAPWQRRPHRLAAGVTVFADARARRVGWLLRAGDLHRGSLFGEVRAHAVACGNSADSAVSGPVRDRDETDTDCVTASRDLRAGSDTLAAWLQIYLNDGQAVDGCQPAVQMRRWWWAKYQHRIVCKKCHREMTGWSKPTRLAAYPQWMRENWR